MVTKLEAFYPDGDDWVSFRTGEVVIPPDVWITGITRPVSQVNVGDLNASSYTQVLVDQTSTTNGESITNTEFWGNFSRQNLTGYFYDCIFRGRITNTANNIVRANHASQSGAIFERCTFENRWFPSDNASNGAHGCIQCHDTTLIRCDMSHAADSLGIIVPGNVTAEGCLMHDHWFFSPDSNHLTDGTHCDGVQSHGGGTIANVDLWGCDIQGLVDPFLPNSQANIPPVRPGGNLTAGNAWYTDYFNNWNGGVIGGGPHNYPTHAYPPWGTSAVLNGYGGGTPILTNWRIRDGWLNGGGLAMVNIAPQYNGSNVNGYEITGNRIGSIGRDRNPADGRPYVCIRGSALGSSGELVISGNVNEDDGTPNNSTRNG